MFDGARYPYCALMCHMALEKALKGLYQARRGEVPPKTHNLVYLISEAQVEAGEAIRRFLAQLAQAQVAARYPEDLDAVRRLYSRPVAQSILQQTQEAVQWIRSQL